MYRRTGVKRFGVLRFQGILGPHVVVASVEATSTAEWLINGCHVATLAGWSYFSSHLQFNDTQHVPDPQILETQKTPLVPWQPELWDVLSCYSTRFLSSHAPSSLWCAWPALESHQKCTIFSVRVLHMRSSRTGLFCIHGPKTGKLGHKALKFTKIYQDYPPLETLLRTPFLPGPMATTSAAKGGTK